MPQSLGFPPRDAHEIGECPCVLIGTINEPHVVYRGFIAFEGELNITASGFEGDQFAGMLTNMKYAKGGFDVDDPSWGPMEPDGDVWCLDTHEFDVELGHEL